MARDDDELEFATKDPEVLSRLSVDELEDYISDLKSEIERAEELIKKKRSATDAANSIFKS